MLKILMIASVITLIIDSCEGDYLNEPTSKGINSFSFKVNGQKWVKSAVIPSYPFMGINLNRFAESWLSGFFQGDIEGDNNIPGGIVEWVILQHLKISDLPKTFSLMGFADYPELYGDIDTSYCYLRFTFFPVNYNERIIFSDIVNGNLEINRFDSICSGTFSFNIASDKDTLSITDGKFDYEIKYY